MLHEIQARPSRGFTGRGLPATQARPSKALRDGLRLTEGGHRLRDRLRFCTPCMGLGYHGVMYQRASASRCLRRGGGLEEHCRGGGDAAKYRLNAKLLGAKFCCANCRRPRRSDLLEIIDDRAGTRATIVTSQLPVEHWHAWIGDATIADAILDRLLSRSQPDIAGHVRRNTQLHGLGAAGAPQAGRGHAVFARPARGSGAPSRPRPRPTAVRPRRCLALRRHPPPIEIA